MLRLARAVVANPLSSRAANAMDVLRLPAGCSSDPSAVYTSSSNVATKEISPRQTNVSTPHPLTVRDQDPRQMAKKIDMTFIRRRRALVRAALRSGAAVAAKERVAAARFVCICDKPWPRVLPYVVPHARWNVGGLKLLQGTTASLAASASLDESQLHRLPERDAEAILPTNRHGFLRAMLKKLDWDNPATKKKPSRNNVPRSKKEVTVRQVFKALVNIISLRKRRKIKQQTMRAHRYGSDTHMTDLQSLREHYHRRYCKEVENALQERMSEAITWNIAVAESLKWLTGYPQILQATDPGASVSSKKVKREDPAAVLEMLPKSMTRLDEAVTNSDYFRRVGLYIPPSSPSLSSSNVATQQKWVGSRRDLRVSERNDVGDQRLLVPPPFLALKALSTTKSAVCHFAHAGDQNNNNGLLSSVCQHGITPSEVLSSIFKDIHKSEKKKQILAKYAALHRHRQKMVLKKTNNKRKKLRSTGKKSDTSEKL